MTNSTTETSEPISKTTSKSRGLPENATWVSPHITVEDVDKSMHFYEKAFQFKKREAAPGEDGMTWHGEMSYQDQMIMLGKSGAYGGSTKTPKQSGIESPMNLYLYCDNVDEFYKKAILEGAQSIVEPADMFWGDRMCKVLDLDGYTWCFATFSGQRK